jgi:hypothetical protein
VPVGIGILLTKRPIIVVQTAAGVEQRQRG